MKNVIWSNFYDEVDFLVEDLRRCDDPRVKELNDYELRAEAHDLINSYHDDELYCLDKKLDGRILVIADLGLWDGRRQAYKILGNNLNEILYFNYELYKVELKRRNVVATEAHHDGTNYYEFREIREGRNIDNLLNDIYSGKEVSRSKINYYTKSLESHIKEAYGI